MRCEISQTVKELRLYQELYGDRIANFDLHKNYAEFPTLEKKHIAKNFPMNLMTKRLEAAIASGQVEYNASSGTTSERMQIVRKPNWWAEENRRTYDFDGKLRLVNQGNRKAVLTTAICSNTVCFAKLPTFEERVMGPTLYLNISPDPNAWTSHDVQRMIDEINRYQPDILDADPIYLALLLRKAEKMGITTPLHQPRVMILTYEYVTSYAKRFIARHFEHVPTIVFYGSTETGYNLFETRDGRFKHVEDRCYLDLEPLQDDIYALKITSWKNEHMPLINYKIGDLVRVSKKSWDEKPHLVDQLCGRLHDTTTGKDGRLVTVGDIEKKMAALDNRILFYQLRFLSADTCQFRYVTATDEPVTPHEYAAIKDQLCPLYEKSLKLTILHEKTISPEVSGKFTVVKKG